MKVVLHEDRGMEFQFKSFDHLAEGAKKSETVFLIVKDFPFFISTGQHVLKRIGVVHSKGSGHKWIVHLQVLLSRK